MILNDVSFQLLVLPTESTNIVLITADNCTKGYLNKNQFTHIEQIPCRTHSIIKEAHSKRYNNQKRSIAITLLFQIS